MLFVACIAPASAQRIAPDTGALQRLLVAEDARGTGADGIKPLLEGLRSRDTLLRQVAVRGLGRLERPELATRLDAALDDAVPSVREAAAVAVAQSVSTVTRRSADSLRHAADDAGAELEAHLALERDPAVRDALAESLGRIPFSDSTRASGAEHAVLAAAGNAFTFGVFRGLYHLAIAGTRDSASTTLLRSAAIHVRDPAIRRVAILALTPRGGLDAATVLGASRDRDDQVRRLALAGIGALARRARRTVVRRAMHDPSVIVRVASVAAAHPPHVHGPCAPIIPLLRDRSDDVALTAIDALGAGCDDSAAVTTALVAIVTHPPASPIPDHAWQRRSHALAALARIDSAGAAPWIAREETATRPGQRVWAARAAANARDPATLLFLAAAADHNVVEAAIDGLASLDRRRYDSVFVAALQSDGNQVVLAAATHLAGTRDSAALPALLDAFDRLSALRSENNHDPRAAVLQRIGELGGTRDATRLTPHLADFDTTIARSVAAIDSRWTRSAVAPRPDPLPIRPEPLAATLLAAPITLRVTMAKSSGGGSFVVRLFNRDAPATAARIVRLVREHYYDGHVFQRVEPDFVVQGGGPDASEYVGDSTFMRDELTARSNLRGTLGVSTRGRDTGDAQWFINLVDNTRLDHEYTVFGEIVAGRAVAERILEGDRIGMVVLR
ncbi:MAG: peptidylprolyl isomerase [Gemmatimonadales bacterium]